MTIHKIDAFANAIVVLHTFVFQLKSFICKLGRSVHFFCCYLYNYVMIWQCRQLFVDLKILNQNATLKKLIIMTSWAKRFLNDTTLLWIGNTFFFTLIAIEFLLLKLLAFLCTIQQEQWHLRAQKEGEKNANIQMTENCRFTSMIECSRKDDDDGNDNSTKHITLYFAEVVFIFGICCGWVDSWFNWNAMLYHFVSRDLHNIYLVQLCQVLFRRRPSTRKWQPAFHARVESQMEIQQAETSH